MSKEKFRTAVTKMKIEECQTDVRSIFSDDGQTYTLILKTSDEEPKKSRITLSEQQQHDLFKYVEKDTEVFFLKQSIDDEIVKEDVIFNNQSLVMHQAENVKYVNKVFENAQYSPFDAAKYQYVYEMFEEVYSKMSDLSKENVETVFLYLSDLAHQKNGQYALDGTAAIIRNTIAFALRNDLNFEEMINLFNLEHSQNITARYSDTEDETQKERFFTTLLKVKSENEITNEDIYRNFRNLLLEKENIQGADKNVGEE